MATSTSYGYAPTADQFLRQSMQLAGLLPLGRNPSATELAHARDHMNTVLKSLSSQGASLTQMERKTLPLVAGTATYALDADTIEVDMPMSLLASGSTSEQWIEPLAWSDYQKLSNKDQQGTPTQVYVEKLATVSIIFWPVPNQAYTLNYRRQRLIRDMESGTTLDLTQRWFEALSYSMAALLARSASLRLDAIKDLEAKADKCIALAKGRENEGTDLYLCLPDL
jgi:hypothetical protein